jgi:hypothetical protein
MEITIMKLKVIMSNGSHIIRSGIMITWFMLLTM